MGVEMSPEDTLACVRCGAAADARTVDVMVCEGCLGRYHAACWSGACACGAASAFGPIGRLQVADSSPVLAPPPRPVTGFLPLGIVGATLGLAAVASFAVSGQRARWRQEYAEFEARHQAMTRLHTGEVQPDVNALYESARAHEHAGKYDLAIDESSQVVGIDRRHEGAWMILGGSHAERCEWREAESAYTHVIELDPRNDEAWSDRGRARASLKDYAGAIADLDRALELDPESVYVVAVRGWARLLMGDRACAEKDCALACSMQPSNLSGWNGRAYLRGVLGDFAGEESDCEAALAYDKADAYTLNNRGFARMNLGKLDAAAEDFERSLARDPKNPYAWENRGHLRLLRGDLEGARADFEKAIEVDTAHERTADVKLAIDMTYLPGSVIPTGK